MKANSSRHNVRHSDIAGIYLTSCFFSLLYFVLPKSMRSFDATTIAWRENVMGHYRTTPQHRTI